MRDFILNGKAAGKVGNEVSVVKVKNVLISLRK
jgi:hypothetical protein